MKSTQGTGLACRPRRRVRMLLAACAVAAAGLAGCSPEGPRPDILLVTIDTLRADHCSSYGYPVPTTPNLDRIGAEGVRFERAYAESSTTAPSHAVLLTGRHFRSYGVTKNGAAIPDYTETLAETLRANGYATAGFVSSFPLKSRFGFAQGFDVYNDTFIDAEASLGRRKGDEKAHDRLAEKTFGHFDRWLGGSDAKKPLFVWIHFVDPHAPYKPPEKFEAVWPDPQRGGIQRYDAEVHYADKYLGRAVERMKSRGRELLTVVTSDHGEGLGDHNWMSHGINLHEEAVRVPLVASWPGKLEAPKIGPAKVVSEAVGIIDIAPGILELLEIDRGTFSHGRPLFGPHDPARPVFLQRRDYKSGQEGGRRIHGEMTAVVENGSKLILAPGENRRELYDLMRDPQELRDLLTGAGRTRSVATGADRVDEKGAESRAGELESRLDQWDRAFPRARKSDAPVDQETLKALRSLGYVD